MEIEAGKGTATTGDTPAPVRGTIANSVDLSRPARPVKVPQKEVRNEKP